MKVTLKSALVGLCLIASTGAWAGEEPPKEEKPSQAIEFLKKTELHGTADVTYNYNFNRPPAGVNTLRAFDTDANSFSPNLFKLSVQNKLVDWAGLQVDLAFGRDARVFQAFGFNDGDNFEIEQAFLNFTAPVGTGLRIKAGKFVTLHGSEVIESANNMNASRSLLFTWAIPFTHTGVMADYTFNDYVTATLGVVNGWDNVQDNNNGKTLHGMLTFNPIPSKLSLILGGSVGPEQAGSDGNIRGLMDAVLTWNALDNLTFVLNADLGKEEGIGGAGFANWYGFAGYAHYRPFDLFGLTLRGEFFEEDMPGGVGVRTATAASQMEEGTLTTHLYLFKGFDLRFEYRLDHTQNQIFAKSDGTTTDFQSTIMTQAVYSF